MKNIHSFFKLLTTPWFLGMLFTFFFVWVAFEYYLTLGQDLGQVGTIQQFIREGHQKSIDWRLRARGPRKGSDQVVILTVDEKAVEQEGRWPWPRSTIKKIIDRLMEGQAKVIGFDIVFADPVRNEGILALEEVRNKYTKGGEEFNNLIHSEIDRLEGARNLGESVEKYADRLVLGTYFEHPPLDKMPFGYQNLCLQKLFRDTQAAEIWDSRSSVVIPIDQTAMEVPDEIPDIMGESLLAHFTAIEKLETEKFLEKRKKEGLSAKMNKTTMIELQDKISSAHWQYCARWLSLAEDANPYGLDEDIDTYRKIWPQIQEEDETLADLSFKDGLRFFKDRQLNSNLKMIGRWWMNLPEISSGAEHSAYFNAFQDPDGTIRDSSLLVRAGNTLFPSLALRTFLVAKGYIAQVTLAASVKSLGNKSITELQLSDDEGEIVGSIPVDEKGQLKINFAGPQKMFAYLSVADVLNDDPSLSITQMIQEKNGVWREKLQTYDKQEFYKDKIFIWGATATGIYDLRVTPFEENFPGVETHANLVDNMLRSDYLKAHPQEESIMLITLLVVGIAFSYLVGMLGAVSGLLVAITMLSILYIIDRFFLFGQGIVVAVIFPIYLVGGLYFILTILKYFTEEKNKKQLKGTFGKYVSPAIVEEILSSPEKIELGGRKEHITVFFSDIRGFTTISEKLDAQTLGDLLNSYLTPMTEIVFRNKGTLDKYMGDAVMAFFGAPIHHPDHAKHAARCALESLEELIRLQEQYRKQGLPIIDMGIGINTGEMSVGNMGSEIVRNYTVMGDAVNLGSRLEGINKQYGTRIILSEFTQKELGDDFITREIDWVRVKGKEKPVRIFELVAEKSTSQEMTIALKFFNQGFELYHQQKWQDASDQFAQALNSKPDDSVSKLYLQRCSDYKTSPPPNDWDGVFVMTSK